MSERMTDEELSEIEARATACPERLGKGLVTPVGPAQVIINPDALGFVAHAREDVTRLAGEVKALRAELAEARASGLTPEQAACLAFAEEFSELAGGGAA